MQPRQVAAQSRIVEIGVSICVSSVVVTLLAVDDLLGNLARCRLVVQFKEVFLGRLEELLRIWIYVTAFPEILDRFVRDGSVARHIVALDRNARSLLADRAEFALVDSYLRLGDEPELQFLVQLCRGNVSISCLGLVLTDADIAARRRDDLASDSPFIGVGLEHALDRLISDLVLSEINRVQIAFAQYGHFTPEVHIGVYSDARGQTRMEAE